MEPLSGLLFKGQTNTMSSEEESYFLETELGPSLEGSGKASPIQHGQGSD